MEIEKAKQAAAYLAASFVQNGMTIGLGTGSTAHYFIEKLIERHQQESLRIQTVSSSTRSLEQAKKGGLPTIEINEIETIDLTVDGADEIDHQKRMIKGGGGALLREKIVASMSREMIVIIDETKLVHQLGRHKLPIEVVPFACNATLRHLRKLGFVGGFRTFEEDSSYYYVTDNGNYIIDLHFENLLANPEKEEALIRSIPGVVETGFFFHLAGRVLVGFKDGQVLIK
jgi:ribose 5-phosphate isomerase A